MRTTEVATFTKALSKTEVEGFARIATLAPAASADELVAAIDQAVAEPSGLALRETHVKLDKVVILAVCDATKQQVTVGVATLRIKTSLAVVWPELVRWYKLLARNRDSATVWAAMRADDRATFELHAIDRSAEPKVDDETALIARIVDHPDDDALREVLADLWLERGDPRGELARLPIDDDRVAAIVKKHGARIARGVTDHATAHTLARGFVDSVTMTGPKFAKYGDAMFRAQPIRTLYLSEPTLADLTAVASAPHVALVRVLDLRFSRWKKVVSPLGPFAGADLARLERLHVSCASIDTAALTAPKLAAIEFKFSTITGDALTGLLGDVAETLETLDLGHVKVASKSGFAPAYAIRLPKLRVLDAISAEFVDGEAIAAWLPRLPALHELRVSSPTLAACRAIAEHRAIERLEIHPGTPTIPELDALLASQTLRDLALFDRSSPEQLHAIATYLLALPLSHPLKSVYMRSNHPAAERLAKRFPSDA